MGQWTTRGKWWRPFGRVACNLSRRMSLGRASSRALLGVQQSELLALSTGKALQQQQNGVVVQMAVSDDGSLIIVSHWWILILFAGQSDQTAALKQHKCFKKSRPKDLTWFHVNYARFFQDCRHDANSTGHDHYRTFFFMLFTNINDDPLLW